MILIIFSVAVAAGFIGYAIGLAQGKREPNKLKETKK
jgi:ABC-type cobalt transport system substrate-binding protein